jgi:hypothetical protein
MNRYCFSLFIGVIIQALRCLPSAAQCQEVEDVLKDIITKEISNPKVMNQEYDTYEQVSCITLGEMTDEDFILLGRGLDYSDLNIHNVDYTILRMVNRDQGIACEHIFIKKKRSTSTSNYKSQFQRQRIQNLIKAKEEQLALLKKQQKYLTTDVLNILGDVLVGEIDAPQPFLKLITDAATKLKEMGVKEVSKYYDLEYEPSENKTANLVREIIDPIDKTLGALGIPTGKWLKYWEALKLTPDGGMAIGNVAAKVRIYVMEKELQDEIEQLKLRLTEIPYDTSLNSISWPATDARFGKFPVEKLVCNFWYSPLPSWPGC